MRAYYQANKTRILADKKQYYLDNREGIIAKQIALDKDKYKTDHKYKMKNILRNRLRIALKKNTKKNKTLSYLGCSLDELKSHLESKFKPGMSWENWSVNGWHVDHIVPLDHFDLSSEEQLLIACHYSNLQPLWADENRRKYNTLEQGEIHV